MSQLPDFIGPAALGIKMGAILPGSNLKQMILDRIKECEKLGLTDEGDIICITESVVARAQKNFVSLNRVCKEISEKLDLKPEDNLGVLFPIISRNRFSLILKALARTVSRGQITLQLSFPTDEVGNQLIAEETLKRLNKTAQDTISYSEIEDSSFAHPITGVDYLQYYQQIIEKEGAEARIILCNRPEEIQNHNPKAVIAADIHSRHKTKKLIEKIVPNCITLDEICNQGRVSSPWGLLGSNLSAEDKLKLAPKNGDLFVKNLQQKLLDATGKKFHLLIYGDGAYKDPTTGIYELADPQTIFGATPELKNRFREGVKYKYLADKMHASGKDAREIEEMIAKEQQFSKKDFETEGTTPRKITDLLASLADLVSGSADAGTPVILVKNFL